MADNVKVQEVNGKYVVTDNTDGGYVNRAETHSYQYWKSCWTKDLQLESLTMNGDDMNEALRSKNDYYHHKALRTKSRHLKHIKEQLGLITPKVKEKDVVLYLEKDGFSFQSPIHEEEAEIKPQTIKLSYFSYKHQQLHFVKATPETTALAKEYNEKLAEFKEYRKEMLKKIFSEGE